MLARSVERKTSVHQALPEMRIKEFQLKWKGTENTI